jgi:hypothetical protein
MADKPYSKREIDSIKEHITGQVTGLSTEMLSGFEAVNKRLDYTNGKVRKITIALVLMGGIMLGAGFQYAPTVLSLIL